MRESKLFSILENLNLSQKRDLKTFIQMPSNHLSARDQVIFNTLIAKKQLKAAVAEKQLWQRILTDKEWNNINRIKNRLFSTLERYICLYQLREEPHFRNLLLANFYTERKIAKNATAILNKGIAMAEKEEDWTYNNQLYLYWYHEIKVEQDKERRTLDHKLQLMESALQEFYSLARIRLICEKANRNRIINGHKEYKQYLNEVERLAKRSPSVHTQAYYWIFKLIAEQDEVYFERLDKYLSTFKIQLEQTYRHEIYEHLMNFCIRRINAGHHLFAEKYLDYILELEDTNALLIHGELNVGTLKNCVLAALLMNKMDWALNFIDKYSDNLMQSPNVEKKAFLELNRAIIELQNNNLEISFKHITNFQTSAMYRKDVYYKITCDKVLLKLFYETKDMEAILSRIESTKDFIRNQHKLSSERQLPHLVFLKILHRLAKKKNSLPEDHKNQLLIPDYLWLCKVTKEDNQ